MESRLESMHLGAIGTHQQVYGCVPVLLMLGEIVMLSNYYHFIKSLRLSICLKVGCHNCQTHCSKMVPDVAMRIVFRQHLLWDTTQNDAVVHVQGHIVRSGRLERWYGSRLL